MSCISQGTVSALLIRYRQVYLAHFATDYTTLRIEELSLNEKVNSLETEEIRNKISGVSDRH
jgi:hypothetical protein